MIQPYFIVDIETVPINLDTYFSKEENERLEFLNPMDSKIFAIGIRYNEKNILISGDDEKEVLEKFWEKWRQISIESKVTNVVGFNIIRFDMPFITARSFINNVKIKPFNLKQIIDIREKINAYRYGKSRGKLKEYAELLGIDTMGIDGADVAMLYKNKETDTLLKYLQSDIEITDKLYKRAVETNIINIQRW